MNQRRHLLALARKGDQKAVNQLMELYQVRVYSGDSLKSMKIRKSLPVLSPPKPKETPASSKTKPAKRQKAAAKQKTPAKQSKAAPKATRSATSKAATKSASPKAKTKISPKKQAKSLKAPKPVRKAKASVKAQSTPKKVARKVSSKGAAKKECGARAEYAQAHLQAAGTASYSGESQGKSPYQREDQGCEQGKIRAGLKSETISLTGLF